RGCEGLPIGRPVNPGVDGVDERGDFPRAWEIHDPVAPGWTTNRGGTDRWGFRIGGFQDRWGPPDGFAPNRGVSRIGGFQDRSTQGSHRLRRFSTRGYGNAALRARRDASSTFRDVGGNWRRLVGTGENALSAASLMSLSSLRSLLGFPARLVPWPPIRARFRDGGARPGW